MVASARPKGVALDLLMLQRLEADSTGAQEARNVSNGRAALKHEQAVSSAV